MIKLAFCDDDPAVLHQLEELLAQYRTQCGQELDCAAFQSSIELLAEIAKGRRFDLLFLDVLMPGECGIAAAREIREVDSTVKIIFLTSSAEYAVESYTVGAYYYQLKPVCAAPLFRLLDSVLAQCRKESEQCLILRCKQGITRVEISTLEYCEVIGRTLFLHLAGGTVLESAGRLDQLQEQLIRYPCFLRPHRSFLINMEYIKSISSQRIEMVCRAKLPIPHGRCQEIKSRYLEYAFERKQVLL